MELKMLKFISFFIRKGGAYRKYANFECSCGNKGIIRADTTRKDGCPKCSPTIKHNMSKSSEYNTWKGMKRRCFNKKCQEYRLYGGVGITVCERWLGENGFKNFLEDMGKKPGPEYSLDRANPYGHYEPDNCRWANPIVQSNNKRFYGKRIRCLVCEKAFLSGSMTKKYCSRSCRDFSHWKPGIKRDQANVLIGRRKRTQKRCLICKNTFMAMYSQKYCGDFCATENQKQRAFLKNKLRKNTRIANSKM
jgi:hypothetical protein